MHRLRSLLTDTRFLSLVGLASILAILFIGAQTLKVALLWASLAGLLICGVWLAVWLVRKQRARKSSEAIGSMLERHGDAAQKRGNAATAAEIEALKKRMHAAVKTIKTSRLGMVSGADALYELPWYITIGNPAAGKSTAIVNSGLKFPFDDGGKAVIKGIGGTRNCDWFFTTEGILLDTAGRYSVHEEDRDEWLGFLGLLKKHRPRAPINGIIVTVSVGELLGSSPSFAISLAKNLRQRVQELTEKLEVFAPVYVLFSKTDLIPGFHEFFMDIDWNERDRVWGATLPYEQQGGNDLIPQFSQLFDELYEGLRAMSVAQLSRHQDDKNLPGLLTFPSEFLAIKPALQAFVATLFEDNPFQFKPVFRGFYFTSATQSADITPVSNERILGKFAMAGGAAAPVRTVMSHGYFLKDLFSKVIFPDSNLVRQHTTKAKARLRLAVVFGSLLVMGLALGGWSWSYMNNLALLANVEQDIAKVVKLQDGRVDLQSRLESIEVLQDRLAQLERFNASHPISIGLGLYQGATIADRLRAEYFSGVRNVMLAPVHEHLEAFLHEVNARADRLQPIKVNLPDNKGGDAAKEGAGAGTPNRYLAARSTNVEDGYNALKTYLMLSSKEHIDAAHLSDQLTRFWRGWLEANRGIMSREQMIRSAGKILSFYLEHAGDEKWPTIKTNVVLVDDVRENLRRVVRGMPAVERVYSEIRARASTRYAPLSVANVVGAENASLVTGSNVVSGAFTVEAWRGYVKEAIKDAATNEQKNIDWVLQSSSTDDLTLDGSPEQIQKSLLAMYKRDYANDWKQFVQGISVAPFDSFPDAVKALNRLGDAQHSPLGTLIRLIVEQTAWDNPAMAEVAAAQAKKGFFEWFKHSVLRMQPSRIQIDVAYAAKGGTASPGPVGKEFLGVARLVGERGNGGGTLLDAYLQQLAKIRTLFNQLGNQGEPGPGAVKLMRASIEGSGSELSETLRLVDEQMLSGLPDSQRSALRPLLVRPLLQSYAALIRPASEDLNKTWDAQVFEPFTRKLAIKYPFDPKSGIEASPAEIAQIFGPDGAIAKYVDASMASLVIRRGNTISPRSWGELGLTLQPEFVNGLARWVGPLVGGAAPESVGGTGAGQGQTVFMLRPQPTPGITGYSIEIDGQNLSYRNGIAQWTNFVWPGSAGAPGVRITATTFDGRNVEIADIPGRYGLEKLINMANRVRQADGSFRMSWEAEGVTVETDLRIVSNTQAQGASESAAGGVPALPRTVVVAGAPVAISTQVASLPANDTAKEPQ